MSWNEDDPRNAIRKLNRVGFAAIIVLLFGIGGWAATTELSGAVIASGSVVVELSIKKVQHPSGGVVGEILVKEGDAVEAGQVVVRLDETVTKATLGALQAQLDELLSREARLLAERDGVDAVAFPEQLNTRRQENSAATAFAGEAKLFASRRSVRVGQRAQLRERITQINEEMRGLTAQFEGKDGELKFIAEELKAVSELYEKNLVSIARLMALQRDQARIGGERGQLTAEIARSRGKISEIELQIIQLEKDFTTEVLKDLRECQGKIAELKERRTAAEDHLKRVDIRAPQSGFVHQLSVHTVGGVIGNGETIMQIVPRADTLVVEAKVAPQDRDQIAEGAKAIVRIMAGNQRTMPDLTGALTYISADLTREQQTGPQPVPVYYTVRASLPEQEVHRLGDLRLMPGMPAEVFIQTYPRTPLEYLIKPLREQIMRVAKER